MLRDVEFQGVYTSSELARLKPLYPGCHKYSRLSGDLKLLQLKARHGWTDKSFKQLLDLLKDMLQERNQVVGSVYEAKKIICLLHLDVERIHACKNNCVLFCGEYEDLDNCPKCGFGRFKRTKDGGDNADDGNEPVKIRGKKGNRGGPVRVAWYFSIILRLKRTFATRKEAQLLRWHKEGRKKTGDGKLRHPADAAQWVT